MKLARDKACINLTRATIVLMVNRRRSEQPDLLPGYPNGQIELVLAKQLSVVKEPPIEFGSVHATGKQRCLIGRRVEYEMDGICFGAGPAVIMALTQFQCGKACECGSHDRAFLATIATSPYKRHRQLHHSGRGAKTLSLPR